MQGLKGIQGGLLLQQGNGLFEKTEQRATDQEGNSEQRQKTTQM